MKTGRLVLRETHPTDSKPGTIQGDFCIHVGRNIIQSRTFVERAEKEVSLWVQPEELGDYKSCAQNWIYEWQEDTCFLLYLPLFSQARNQPP